MCSALLSLFFLHYKLIYFDNLCKLLWIYTNLLINKHKKYKKLQEVWNYYVSASGTNFRKNNIVGICWNCIVIPNVEAAAAQKATATIAREMSCQNAQSKTLKPSGYTMKSPTSITHNSQLIPVISSSQQYALTSHAFNHSVRQSGSQPVEQYSSRWNLLHYSIMLRQTKYEK